MKKTAFVTGGTGFVGSHLVEELLSRDVDEVRCLVRSDPKWLSELDVTYVKGTLSDVETLWEALDGVTHVYHAAGRTRAPNWSAFYETNVQGTLNLMGAVKQAAPHVDRVVVTSSLAAVGRCDAPVATEEAPLAPVSQYGRSKAEMEAALTEAHQMNTSYSDALPITVVRPSAVYGPRDRDILDFFKAVQWHVCPILRSGPHPGLSLIHVRDLARGIVDASVHPDADGEAYLLGSKEPYSWTELKRAATSALGTWAVRLPVPGPLISATAMAAEVWGRLTNSHPPFNRDKAREIRSACTACSIEKATRELGWAPQISLDAGMSETVDWYRAQDWL